MIQKSSPLLRVVETRQIVETGCRGRMLYSQLLFTDGKSTLQHRLCLLIKAASALEDALYNFTRPIKTLHVELANPSDQARWQQRTPAMAAKLTDHIWTVQELLTTVLVPQPINT